MSPVLNKNQRIAKNTVLLYIRMFFSMAVSLYTSRVILNVLGIENYGIYNIVGGVVVLFSFLSNALTQATQRFLTYALGEGNNDYFKKVFSISFFIYIGISFLVVVIAETFGLWLLYEKLVIPEGRFYAAMVTFQFSVLAFVINLMRIPYNAAIIAYERMSFYAYISIVEVVFKLLIVFFLYWSYYDKLIFYSLLVVIVTLLINGGYYLFCKFYLEGCKLNCYWNKKLFKDLMSFSGWSMLGSTSVIASNQGINILMNIYFGVVVNGAIGIANQVSNAVNQFVSNFQIAFNPQLIKSYASKDFVYLNKLTLFSAKFSFFLLMVIILPILLETHTVLNIWLIEVPDYLVQFTQLTLLLLLFDSFSGPLLTLLQASGNIRKYQIYVSILYTVTFFISWLLYFNGMNVYSSFGVKFIVSTLFSFFIRLYFTYKETNMDFCVYSFLKNVFVRSLVFFVCSLIIMLCFCHVLIDVDLTVKLFVIIVLNIFVSSFLFWIVVLDSDEKKSIINNIKQRKTRSSYDSK